MKGKSCTGVCGPGPGGFQRSSQQARFEGNSIPIWPIAGIAAVAKTTDWIRVFGQSPVTVRFTGQLLRERRRDLGIRLPEDPLAGRL